MRGMTAPVTITRRQLLAAGLGSGALLQLVESPPALARAAGRQCAGGTPVQTQGPFYPTARRPDEDADLTTVAGRAGRAQGEVIQLRCRILDDTCSPVEGALVEVWQANAWGRYDHERDTDNPRPLDPCFQGWARLVTGAGGTFSITTIKPGSYPAGEQGWTRPPHIHFKVSRRSFHEAITQMYFQGEPLNERDRIRAALSPEDQTRVTVEFGPSADHEGGARLGSFDIALVRAI